MNKPIPKIERFKADGAGYLIIAEWIPTGWIANWRCLNCQCSGGPNSTFPNAEDAITHCKINLSPHHDSHHRKAP